MASTDPTLDPFNPDNGPPFSPGFIDRYRAGQRARNARITAWCHAELDRLHDHGISDRLFTMSRTWADLRMIDGAIDPSARTTPWCYAGEPKRANAGVFGIGSLNTCRTWLNMWSLTESDCGALPHLARLDLPTLLIQPDADNGVSRRRPTRSSPLLRRPTRSTSRCPVITTSWSLRPRATRSPMSSPIGSTPADGEIALPGGDGGGDVLATPG